MKLAIAVVVVLAGLLLAAVVLNLTPEGRGVVQTVFGFVSGLAAFIWSLVLGLAFFVLPFLGGKLIRGGLERVDAFFDPGKPFPTAVVLAVGAVFGIVMAGLQLVAFDVVNGNQAVARFLATLGTSGLLAFGPVSALAWAAFGLIGFVVGYFLLRGRRAA